MALFVTAHEGTLANIYIYKKNFTAPQFYCSNDIQQTYKKISQKNRKLAVQPLDHTLIVYIYILKKYLDMLFKNNSSKHCMYKTVKKALTRLFMYNF